MRNQRPHQDAEQLAVAILTALREQEASGWHEGEVLAYLRDTLREVLPAAPPPPDVDPVEVARMTDEGCPHDPEG